MSARTFVRPALVVLLIAGTSALSGFVETNWHGSVRTWWYSAQCCAFFSVFIPGLVARDRWKVHEPALRRAHGLALVVGLALVAWVPGQLSYFVGKGIVLGVGASAIFVFAEDIAAGWRRLAKPLRPVLDVIWGDANDSDPPGGT